MKYHIEKSKIYEGLRTLGFSETQSKYIIKSAYSFKGKYLNVKDTTLKAIVLASEREWSKKEKKNKIRKLYKDIRLIKKLEDLEINGEDILYYIDNYDYNGLEKITKEVKIYPLKGREASEVIRNKLETLKKAEHNIFHKEHNEGIKY